MLYNFVLRPRFHYRAQNDSSRGNSVSQKKSNKYLSLASCNGIGRDSWKIYLCLRGRAVEGWEGILRPLKKTLRNSYHFPISKTSTKLSFDPTLPILLARSAFIFCQIDFIFGEIQFFVCLIEFKLHLESAAFLLTPYHGYPNRKNLGFWVVADSLFCYFSALNALCLFAAISCWFIALFL